MPFRPCIVCGQLGTASYCPTHAPRTWAGGSTRAWRGLRAQAILRDGHACQRCGRTDGLQVHHIIPKHHGGRDVLGNLATLCGPCHAHEHGAGPAAA